MKKLFLLPLMLFSVTLFAEPSTNDDWENSTISDATIKKIQESKYVYKKCVADEMQKAPYQAQSLAHWHSTFLLSNVHT